MAIRKIAQLGEPVLRRKQARPLTAQELVGPRIASLLEDMVETMHDAAGIRGRVRRPRKVRLHTLIVPSDRVVDGKGGG